MKKNEKEQEQQYRFLSVFGLPGRLTAEETAWAINCQPHDIPALLNARLLKPLGNPPPKAIKFFCTADVLDLIKDRAWLIKVTNTINQHWHRQNSRTKRLSANGSPNGQSALLALSSTTEG